MDPALWEAIREGRRTGEEIEAIVRLDDPDQVLPDARVVSRIGRFATVRLRPGAVLRTRRQVRSLKASRILSAGLDTALDTADSSRPSRISDLRRHRNVPWDGSGVVVGVADWSFDFMHPNFRNSDGTTRILALWDQRDNEQHDPPEPYGYGAVHTRDDINRALASSNPGEILNYFPGDSDARCSGSHGSHVADIAAGSGAVGPAGMAPNADLIFVHLANKGTRGLANLGDSVRLIEAVDFISRTAGDQSFVANYSVGRHGGPHNGRTLAEMAFDEMLAERPGRFIVQSAGNYQGKDIHSCGKLERGETHELRMHVDRADFTPNELEIWTSAGNELSVEVESPTGVVSKSIALGRSGPIIENGVTVGTIYNRASDPNSHGDNHVNLFLYPSAPPGLWTARLHADVVSDGIFHAWLERDDSCASCQTRFAEGNVNSAFTTGTLANSTLPLVVGAYNNHSGQREIASFSSSGPTRDGRMKPDLLAPGVRILAARSHGASCDESYKPLTRKSGTSMAAPHVTGTVALVMQSIKRPLWSHEIRGLILKNTDPPTNVEEHNRAGHGYLNVPKLMRAIQQKPADLEEPRETEAQMNPENTAPVEIDADAVFGGADQSMGAGQVAPGFNVIAWPGSAPESTPEPGDILIRVAEGEPGLGSASELETGSLWSAEQAADADWVAESHAPGYYTGVHDMAGGASIARRILDEDGRMPSYQMLLRPDTEKSGRGGTDSKFKAGEKGGAILKFHDLNKAVGGDNRPHLYYVTTGAHNRGRDPAIVNLRIRNPNSVWDFEKSVVRTRLRNIQAPGDEDIYVKLRGAPDDSNWRTKRIGEIKSGRRKDIQIPLHTSTLHRAHDSDNPLTSLDVAYLYDEGFSDSSKRYDYYRNHHLSFYLVDPIEVMWSQRTFVKEVSFNNRKKHQHLWRYIHEKTFTRHDRTGVGVTLTVGTHASYTRGGQMTFTVSGSTEQGTTISAKAGIERGGSAKIGVSDFLEVGLSGKNTAELGVSRTFKTTKGFARTIARSESMTRAFETSETRDYRIPGGRPGYVHTLWAYPKLKLYKVPIVIFDGINEFGQATRRTRVEDVPLLELVGWGGVIERTRRSGYKPRRRKRKPKPPKKDCPSGDAECERNSESSSDFVIARRMPAWQHLISFRPPHRVQRRIHNRALFPRWNIHKIEDASGNLNLDYYPVSVTRLPVVGGRRLSAEELLEHLRTNINRFVDTDYSEFTPYSRSDRRIWTSGFPLGAVVHIDMRVAGGFINPDDGSVVCSQHHPDNWIFSTVWTTGDQAHPVSGNRQFGFMPTDNGGYIFFTRAADRITRSAATLAEGMVWNGADKLWRSLQRKLTNFINVNGGVAVWTSRTSRRYNWPSMKRRYHRPTTTWLY